MISSNHNSVNWYHINILNCCKKLSSLDIHCRRPSLLWPALFKNVSLLCVVVVVVVCAASVELLGGRGAGHRYSGPLAAAVAMATARCKTAALRR